ERAISSPQGMSLHLRSSPQCVRAVQEYIAHSQSVFSRLARDLIPDSPPPAFSLCCCHPGGSPAWLPRSVPLLAPHSLLKSPLQPAASLAHVATQEPEPRDCGTYLCGRFCFLLLE